VSLEFFIHIKSFRSHYGHGVDSTSSINEYQEHFLGLCVRLTTLPQSCALVMKSGNLTFLELHACNGTAFTITLALDGHLCSTSRPDSLMSSKESYSTGGWCPPDTSWTFWRREKSLAPTVSFVMAYEISVSVDQVLLMFLFCLILGRIALTEVTIRNSMPVSPVVSCCLRRLFLFIFGVGNRLFEQIQFCNILAVFIVCCCA